MSPERRETRADVPRDRAIPSIWIALAHAAGSGDDEAAALLAGLMTQASETKTARSPR